jgi:CheY-like chemotaxis protein
LEDARIDALFTDIRLPEGDFAGFELAQQARERSPSLKVIYTTGEAIGDQMKALYVDGATMLPKPYTDDDLRQAVVGKEG